MKNADIGMPRKIAREIGEEAGRQVRGFPSELPRQVGSGWGEEFARQILGNPRNCRGGS